MSSINSYARHYSIIEDWVNDYNIDLSALDFNTENRTNPQKSKNAEMQKCPKQPSVKTASLSNEEIEAIRKTILQYHKDGETNAEIAIMMHASNTPTLSGTGVWNTEKVRGVLRRLLAAKDKAQEKEVTGQAEYHH